MERCDIKNRGRGGQRGELELVLTTCAHKVYPEDLLWECISFHVGGGGGGGVEV